MHPKRKQRLIIACVIVVLSSAAVGLVTYALRGNINLFYPPADVVAGKAPLDRPIRVGGMVVEGSIRRSDSDLTTTFDVTDYDGTVTISYTGILPDLFAEGEGVVAAGTLDVNGHLVASEVLAKHDENYMPPEVAAALEGKVKPTGNAGYTPEES
jgi:cytochrome c-type biogenesis protein CcmE